jgi:Tfp pilus assembly protein PilX
MNEYLTLGHNLKISGNQQRGVITLVISLVVLMLSTFVVFNVSKAILMEQKISNNDMRAKQAFEAAEAGMNVAIEYLDTNPDRDGTPGIDPVFDLNPVDGIGDNATATIGRASVTVTTSVCAAGAATGICITSTGRSDDRTATQTVTQILMTINPLPNAPQNPVTVRGGIIIGGAAVVENPEGFSTIWSGSDVDVGGNQTTTTLVPDVNATTGPNAYPGCMDVPLTCATISSSNKLVVGVDVIENDSSLSSLSDPQFFQNFFGMAPLAYQSSMVTINATTADAEASITNALSEVIWVQGNADVNGNITMGSLTQPSILIITGNLSVNGNVTFNGIVYVMGNITVGSGNTTIIGAAVVAGQANGGGGLLIRYSSDVLGNTSLAGSSTGGAGSWRDFN